jgi:hypothetical protein
MMHGNMNIKEYNSLTQKLKHRRRMIIFVEIPTVRDSVAFCISVNWNRQPVADMSGAIIFKPHVLSYWAAVGNAAAVVTACT